MMPNLARARVSSFAVSNCVCGIAGEGLLTKVLMLSALPAFPVGMLAVSGLGRIGVSGFQFHGFSAGADRGVVLRCRMVNRSLDV